MRHAARRPGKAGFLMTRVECILRPNVISDVKEALAGLGIHGMTVTEVIGCGFQKGHAEELGWNTELNINLLPKTKLESIVPDELADTVIATVVRIAHTGEVGDGKIFTSPVTNALRIRTEETGAAAI